MFALVQEDGEGGVEQSFFFFSTEGRTLKTFAPIQEEHVWQRLHQFCKINLETKCTCSKGKSVIMFASVREG